MSAQEARAEEVARNWRLDALCANHPDLEIFFPKRGGSGITEAKALCDRCPVRTPCYDEGVEAKPPWGVWGKTSERDRRKLSAVAAPAKPVVETTVDELRAARNYVRQVNHGGQGTYAREYLAWVEGGRKGKPPTGSGHGVDYYVAERLGRTVEMLLPEAMKGPGTSPPVKRKVLGGRNREKNTQRDERAQAHSAD